MANTIYDKRKINRELDTCRSYSVRIFYNPDKDLASFTVIDISLRMKRIFNEMIDGA